MQIKILFLSILFPTCLVVAAPYIFDFGTTNSPLHKGAVLVTTAGGQQVAWQAEGQCKSRVNPIEREGTLATSDGKKSLPQSYQTELTCDYIHASLEQTLAILVPAGAYKLLLLSGRAGGRAEVVWDLRVTSSDNNSAAATFAGAHELRTLYLDAVAGAKGIELTFSTRSQWLINALIVVPAAEWEQVHASTIQPILAACCVLPPEVLEKWRETPRLDTTPKPVWTPRQQQEGLAFFTRPWCEPVWPDHLPRQHEISMPARAFASWNEYEPITFTLHALKAFSTIDVRISDLINTSKANNAAIPAEKIETRFVRYMYVRPNYTTPDQYYRAPDVLMPWQPQPLSQGENLRLWLTLRIPYGQPEGLYHGSARVRADTIELEVPITLRVLPITLQRDQSLIYGQYYHHPLRNLRNAPDDFSRAWWQAKAEAEHRDMREHGMNTVVLGLSGWLDKEDWRFQFDWLQRDIDLARSVGFDKPIVCSFPFGALYYKYMKASTGSHLAQVQMPPDAFFDELTAMVRTIEAEARRRQWPELLYYPVDEPSVAPLSVAFMTRVLAAIKRVPNVRTYVTADPEHEQFAPLRPYLDLWCCQPFSLGRNAVMEDMRERGVEYWCYPNHIAGENDHTPTLGARMTYGFGFWQSGYRALIPWIYQAVMGDQWNYLDSNLQDFFNRTADDASPVPVALWEAYREGIDDHRYVYTLQSQIARVKASGHQEQAASAQALLEQILTSIKVQTKYKNDGLWAPEAFDAWRWLVAEQILVLQMLPDRLAAP
ncbi:MAG: hypothetical protein PHO37_14525 [Kiritimatiellae bacterium]|nr:hypothetical protein [Kiritimatiellia bacterium]